MSNGLATLADALKSSAEVEFSAIDQPPSLSASLRQAGRRNRLLARLGQNHHVLSLADQALVSGTNFATTVLIGRMAWEAELGTYWLGMTLVLLLLSALNSLVSSPLMLLMQRRDGLSPAELSGVALIHCLSLAALASTGFLGLGAILYWGAPTHDVGVVLMALTLLAPLLMLREFARRVALSKMRYFTVLIVDAAVCLLQLTGLVWLGSGGRLNSVTAFVASGVACGIAVSMWLFAARQEFEFPWHRMWPTWTHNWLAGKWILVDQLTVTANMYLLYWLLAFLKDTSATGVYSACMAIVSLANPFVFGMTNVLAPRLAHANGLNDSARVRRLVWTSTAILATVVGGYCLLLLCWGDQIVALCYGAQFTGQHWTIITCTLAMFAGVMGTSVSFGLWVKQRNDINFTASLIGMLVTLAIAVPLLNSGGAVAANAGLLAGNTVATLLRFAAFVRIDRRSTRTTPRTRPAECVA